MREVSWFGFAVDCASMKRLAPPANGTILVAGMAGAAETSKNQGEADQNSDNTGGEVEGNQGEAANVDLGSAEEARLKLDGAGQDQDMTAAAGSASGFQLKCVIAAPSNPSQGVRPVETVI